MTKTDLIAAIAENTGLSKKDATAAFNAAIGAVEGALAAGDKVQLPGFGTLEVKARAARTGKNPRTGEPVAIPASKSVAFKCGKALKEKVNQ